MVAASRALLRKDGAMGWRVVSGEVVVDSDHGDMLLDIETLRVMRQWATAQRRTVMLGEGKFDANPKLTYSESIDMVENEYPQGIRGFLADSELV